MRKRVQIISLDSDDVKRGILKIGDELEIHSSIGQGILLTKCGNLIQSTQAKVIK